MALFVNILALAVPVFVLQVYDRVVFHAGLSTLQGLVIGMAAVLVFDYVLRQARARVMQTVALRIDVVVGRRLFDKLMSLPLQVLESRPAAYWQALFRDVDVVRNTVSGASALLIADLPFAVLFLALTFVIAAPIAWVLLVILPLFLFVAWRSGNTMATANRDERESAQARDGLIAEMIVGRTTIKALALDRAMRPYWEERHADNIERATVRGAKADGYANLGTTLTMLTTVALTTVGAAAIINQHLTIGALIATNMLSGRLLGPFNQLVGTWRTYAGFRQAIERLGHVFDIASERQTGEIALPRPLGELTLEDVVFSYSEAAKPVVDTVSVTFEVGGVHALIGRNGSGKSTLLKLAQGLYPPSKGRVLLDGADVAQFTRTELARWIGYVPQECVLFAGTLRDNIGLRKPEATDEEIIEAATAAGVHEFIIDFPDGYASEIGEAGQRLSAGQRQRIAIARALVGAPPVLLLDEPSNSLDRQAEQELSKTLAAISKDRTVVVVTHSQILLSVCKDIVALDRGRIALAGPAEQVLPRLWGGVRVLPHGGQTAEGPAIVDTSLGSKTASRREGAS
jgi:ATP-binding cassette, subfamily C, bacterial LapB